MNIILASNLNMKYIRQKSIFPKFSQCLKWITSCMSNQPSYLHSKSEHPNSTKKIIAYNQALRFTKICYNRSHLHNNCTRLLNTLTKKGYNKTDTAIQINRAITIPRSELLSKIKASNTERLPRNMTVRDLKTIIDNLTNNFTN